MKKQNIILEKTTNIFLNILIGIFVIILLVSIYSGFQVKVLKNDYANFFGYSMFEVQTGSMSDYIEAGDWIILKLTKNVDTNDVITYKQDGNYITHRIIEAYNGTYITKGDANSSKDEPIDQTQIVGKVVKVLGGFGIFRKTIFNPNVIIALIITLWLFNLVFNTNEENIKRRNKIKTIINDLINKYIKKEAVKQVEKTKKNEEIKPIKQETIIKEEPIITESQKEEELSKTSMFRVVKIKDETAKEKIKEEKNEEEKEIKSEEELSKTSVFRIISADTSDIDRKIKKEVKKEKEEPTKVYKVTLEAEKVVKKLDKHNTGKNEKGAPLDLEGLKVKCDNTKSKNIIEKSLKIKRIEISQIIDILLEKERAYVMKSNLRDDFIVAYMTAKYHNGEDSKNITKVKSAITDLSQKLSKKYIRDEKQQIIINAYSETLKLIAVLEQNRNEENKNKIYEKEIKKCKNWDKDYITYVIYNINEVQEKCMDIMDASLKKLETNTFEIELNKIVSKKDLYAVVLNHNISFSKVYSEYIVDKTYNEGIVAEDKIAVLLTLLSGQIARDIMAFDYSKKYIIHIPKGLYEKEKKLDGLLKLIDDDYAKNHVFILVDIETIFANKKTTTRLKKDGYNLSILINKKINMNEKSLGYLYMADYLFIDKEEEDITSLIEIVPNELLDKIIKENAKKLGDFGGE